MTADAPSRFRRKGVAPGRGGDQGGPVAMETRPYHSERRRYLRVSTDLAVGYWLISQEGIRIGRYHGVARNISRNGMELVAKLPPEILVRDLLMQAAAICVEVLLPGSAAPVRVMARIIWAEPCAATPSVYRVGLEFREITTADRARLVDYIISERISAGEPFVKP